MQTPADLLQLTLTLYDCKFVAAIAGFAKLVNLIYHHKFLLFAAKCREFDLFHPFASK